MARPHSPLALRVLLLLTDLGFLAYWALTLGHFLPPSWLYSDYREPVTVAWNQSFLPLDLLVSASGLSSVALERRCPSSARTLLLVSLVGTSISGLQALSFWAFRHELDPAWWAANGFLLLWPLPFLARMIWSAPSEPHPT